MCVRWKKQDPPTRQHPADVHPSLCPPLFFPALIPQESVALLLKQPALIGLDASELRTRLSGLAAAVGCEPAKAVRLALHSANLIMLHPDYVKVSITISHVLLPSRNHHDMQGMP